MQSVYGGTNRDIFETWGICWCVDNVDEDLLRNLTDEFSTDF